MPVPGEAGPRLRVGGVPGDFSERVPPDSVRLVELGCSGKERVCAGAGGGVLRESHN